MKDADRVRHVGQLFQAIEREGVRLKFSRCIFAAESVKHLDHIIQKKSFRALKDNSISIKKTSINGKRKQILPNYQKNIPIKLEPLHKLMGK